MSARRRCTSAALAALALLSAQWRPAEAQQCVQPGLSVSARHYTSDLMRMPDWSSSAGVDASSSGTAVPHPSQAVADAFSYVVGGTSYTSNVAVVYEGWLQAPVDGISGGEGSWVFQLNSTDGARFYIDDGLKLDNDGLHKYGADFSIPLTKSLTFGKKSYAIRVEYFKGNDPATPGAGLALAWDFLRSDPPPSQSMPGIFTLTHDACASDTPPVLPPPPPPSPVRQRHPTRVPTPRRTKKPTSVPTRRPTKKPTHKKTKKRKPRGFCYMRRMWYWRNGYRRSKVRC